MEKFTKGKWESRVTTIPIDTALVYFADEGGIDLSGAPDCIANAHLIAAAPEMYAMLKDIFKNYECGSVIDDQIESLLAKARGE